MPITYTELSQLPEQEADRWETARIMDDGRRFVRFGMRVEATTTLECFLKEVDDRLIRWRIGHYTIEEAALILADGTDERVSAEKIRAQMNDAVKNGTLLFRENGIPLSMSELAIKRLNRFSMLRQTDINKWLRGVNAGYELVYPYADIDALAPTTTQQARAMEVSAPTAALVPKGLTMPELAATLGNLVMANVHSGSATANKATWTPAMKNIGYSEFVLLCNVDDPEEWCGWLSLRPDGVYVKPPPSNIVLTPNERSVLTEHPLHDLTKPVLAFPCSFDELRAFDETQGLGLGLDVAYEDSQPPAPAVEPATHALKGITTAEIVEAFGGLVKFKLGKAMTDGAAWTLDARLSRGTRGGRHKSLWDPVRLATALRERRLVSLPKLNLAFNSHGFLAQWREEWNWYSTM